MNSGLNVTIVSGGLQKPSKTDALLNAMTAQLGSAVPIETTFVRLSDLQPALGAVAQPAVAPPHVIAALEAIQSADVLVVGTPVFRGSYPGLFKHLFDLVDRHALIGKPVLLAATGGSERHALMLDHQLRPLFSFFQALTLPLGVYATDRDFTAYRVTSPALTARIELTVERALPWLQPSPAAPGVTSRAPFSGSPIVHRAAA